MNSAVTYSVVARKKPSEKDAPIMYYAQAQARGEADIRTLSDRIEVMCTVTRADVMAVLVALETVIKDSLSNGEIVRLGELGSLQMGLSSHGVLTEEDFNASMIYKSRILFRPGLTLSAMQATLRYKRVPKKLDKAQAEQGPDASPEGSLEPSPEQDSQLAA